jgi:putative Ca2+/H+ antiporter (TMEM165/GDT1 family)
MHGFFVSLGLTFWSEMGDKTQFVAMAFATRHKTRHVLLGIAWAIALVLLLSVGIGRFLTRWVPVSWTQILAAVSFFAFGVWTLFEKESPGGEQVEKSRIHPIWRIGTTFFLAEIGDKTMFTAMALATTWGWFPVWVGSSIGMAAADALGVWFGMGLLQRIPEKVMKAISAACYFGFAAWSAWQARHSF